MKTRTCHLTAFITLACGVVTACASTPDPRDTTSSPAVKAPPSDCPPPFVEKGEWTIDEYGPILHITPTACGRQARDRDPTYVDVFDDEVISKFSGNPLWDMGHNTRGLLDQLECHVRLYPDKPTYNIEPTRPYVGRRKTEQEQCNPSVYDPDPAPKT
ncbi:DUF2599 domain-containing protein [Luteibacter sp. 22Crub2.1]|uniref:DUF2599 domain-containing protein n=1 Tax=Luteibacter sp. 22Crub2.1 TaxID=1283288 RepID=UPI0009A5726E|nr:DUF2599 domain-containing protein [Luteibacter sp. 22Crub2.1]SKB37758.1 Protein of unknown function [Luteibacter sp. 22Crub2.1]